MFFNDYVESQTGSQWGNCQEKALLISQPCRTGYPGETISSCHGWKISIKTPISCSEWSHQESGQVLVSKMGSNFAKDRKKSLKSDQMVKELWLTGGKRKSKIKLLQCDQGFNQKWAQKMSENRTRVIKKYNKITPTLNIRKAHKG